MEVGFLGTRVTQMQNSHQACVQWPSQGHLLHSCKRRMSKACLNGFTEQLSIVSPLNGLQQTRMGCRGHEEWSKYQFFQWLGQEQSYHRIRQNIRESFSSLLRHLKDDIPTSEPLGWQVNLQCSL